MENRQKLAENLQKVTRSKKMKIDYTNDKISTIMG